MTSLYGIENFRNECEIILTEEYEKPISILNNITPPDDYFSQTSSNELGNIRMTKPKMGHKTYLYQFNDAVKQCFNRDKTVYEMIRGSCHLFMFVQNLYPEVYDIHTFIQIINLNLINFLYSTIENDSIEEFGMNSNIKNFRITSWVRIITPNNKHLYRIIAQSENYCFASPVHTGVFAKAFYTWLDSSRISNQIYDSRLYDKNGNLIFDIDMAIYRTLPIELRCITKKDINYITYDSGGNNIIGAVLYTEPQETLTNIGKKKYDKNTYRMFCATFWAIEKDIPDNPPREPTYPIMLYPHYTLIKNEFFIYDYNTYMRYDKRQIIETIKQLNRYINTCTNLQNRLLKRLNTIIPDEDSDTST
jgi:hypothetical protein